jgi:hypothetical protein
VLDDIYGVIVLAMLIAILGAEARVDCSLSAIELKKNTNKP